LQVTFYGVRGSTPCCGDEIARYGGNTSCVAVRVPGEPPLLLDMGTGIRYFGRSFAKAQVFRGNCLLSHLHWDHTQGLPFFTPMLTEGSELDVYGPSQTDGRSVAQVMTGLIRPPMFPIDLDQFPGTIRFHDTLEGTFDLGEIRVTAREIPHVGRTFGYRIEWQGLSVAYLPDHQQPYDGGFRVSEAALELVRGVDLLIHDSQYTAAEFAAKSTWGHCTAEYAMWLSGHAGVKRLALFHHDPARTDDALDEFAACARALASQLGYDVVTASEGLTIDVAAPVPPRRVRARSGGS
jgi:ribonuclease BN (tRNA processing enzyme)